MTLVYNPDAPEKKDTKFKRLTVKKSFSKPKKRFSASYLEKFIKCIFEGKIMRRTRIYE
jgi:hypothetical protein